TRGPPFHAHPSGGGRGLRPGLDHRPRLDRGRRDRRGAAQPAGRRAGGAGFVRRADRGAGYARRPARCHLSLRNVRRRRDPRAARVRRARRPPRGGLPHGGRARLGPPRARPGIGLARRRLRAPDPARGGRAGAGPFGGYGRGGGRGSARGDPVVRKFLAIVGREWRAYFFSPLAYVILAAFLLMNGMIFAAIVSFLNTPGAPKGQALPFLFTNTYFWIFNLFVVPIITMRLFAEERKSGTIETLLTSPVSETTVVLGKFTGALGFFLTLWAPTLVYVLILRSQTPIDLGPVAAGYLAIALIGAYFLSIGTF